MNTKPIPAIVALIAAAITCIYSLINKAGFHTFTKRLVIVVLIFFVIGGFIKFIADKWNEAFQEPEETDETEKDLENISSDYTIDDEDEDDF